ncbi:MAG: helix-turn-helix transcriptional regulator [Deltaproteobacteria bacterium]|nr:helix-turn-helix transcriptional regulator [Deltaproteobacteria bacterium]
MDEIGTKLKAFREARHLTLKGLADAAGCTGALISQIENGHTSPSIAMLKKIAAALSVNIVDFFDNNDGGEQIVTRELDRKNVYLSRWDAKVQQLVPSTQGRLMQPFFTTIKPLGGSREPYTHQGQEFGFVIKGALTITVGDETFQVRPKESFYYSSVLPHTWVNESEEDVEVVWVVCPPTW